MPTGKWLFPPIWFARRVLIYSRLGLRRLGLADFVVRAEAQRWFSWKGSRHVTTAGRRHG
jgi:hypothetical protein